eukprot:PITA_00926
MEFYTASFLAVLLSVSVTTAAAAPPAQFIFGDSLFDSGINNYLASTARADRHPYGIDYPNRKPTGRFSNGLNLADFICLKLGSDLVLPYLHPSLKGKKLLKGANFASAGIGILNDTGVQFAEIIRMPHQFELFQEYKDRVAKIIGRDATNKLVAEGLFSISLGGNDYVNNYYLLPVTVRSLEFSLPAYTDFIISEFEKILAQFYDLGARRVLVLSSGPLGCVPMERALRSTNGECVPVLQQATQLFNDGLTLAIDRLNTRFSAPIYTMTGMFPIYMNLYTNPQAFGLGDAKNACCGQGPYNGIGLCTALSNLCPDRGNNVWWDQFHPTERAAKIIVDQFFSNPSYVSPISLKDLMKLDV